MTARHDGVTGRVTLVGAGPGDPGLLTLRGLRALEAADVIVADRLGARGGARRTRRRGRACCAPRSSTSASSPATTRCRRTAINELLVALARDGKRVVRLKGGDPFIFGRGGEEVAFCRDAGVDVEVVPGVTSAISVPAIAGIPLTHRGLATTFTVVTGHDQIQSLGGGRDHTVVLLMGIGTLANSAITLARGERGGDCPVAIIEDGYGPGQRVTIGTLDTIALQAARARHPLARGRRRRRRRDPQPVRPRGDRRTPSRPATPVDPLATAGPPTERPRCNDPSPSASRSSAPAPPASTPPTS